ncbi:GIY-YIG nuclease family protein [Pseudarthrobacter enclensis]|uniref:GIY-YIG nuclease family protein n=1 Tax=Pseudarthrobacter enclensis TaxID=993070 RepID=UPI00352B09A6
MAIKGSSMPTEKDPGNIWQDFLLQINPRKLPIVPREVPAEPGVYVWFREAQPVYVGKASGTNGLRSRLRSHLHEGTDFSRSTFRASVAAAQLGIPRSFVRQRPSVMTLEQAAVANEWLAGCEVGWLVCASAEEAQRLEDALRNEWLPPLNLV